MRKRRLPTRCALTVPCIFGPALLFAQQYAPPAVPASNACQQAYVAHHYQDAARCFQQVAASASTDMEAASGALLGQAQALLHLDDLTGAESALRRCLQAAPRNAPALYLLAFVLQRRNLPSESLRTYTQAAALQRPSAEDLRRVALDYVLLQDYASAEHWLQRALGDDPANAEAWYDLGRVHMHGDHFAAASADLRHSLALRPESAKAEDNLGVCLEAQNQTDAALEAYTRAVRVADSEPHPSEQPYIDLGRLLVERNNAAAARPVLTKAATLNPHSSTAHAQLSRAASAMGDLPSAVAEMEKAVQLEPGNPRLHFQLGRLYRSAGSPDRARQEFDRSSALYGHTSKE